MHQYKKLLSKHHSILKKFRNLESKAYLIKIIVFFVGIIFFPTFLLLVNHYLLSKILLFVFSLLFLTTHFYHEQIKDIIRKKSIWYRLIETEIAKKELNWSSIPISSIDYKPYAKHSYAKDLNIIGNFSLFNLINATVTKDGEEKLLSILLDENVDQKKSILRQNIIKDLKDNVSLRRKFLVLAKTISNEKLDGKNLVKFVTQNIINKKFKNYSYLIFGLYAVSILFLISQIFFNLSDFFYASFFSYYFLVFISRIHLSKSKRQSIKIHTSLKILSEMIHFLAHNKIKKHSQTFKLLKPIIDNEKMALTLKNFYIENLFFRISSNTILYFVTNLFFPISYLLPYFIEKMRLQTKNELPKLIETISRFDAFLSLSDFAYINEDYSYPTFIPEKEKHSLNLKNLTHPLISKENNVSNNIQIGSKNQGLLISGGHMSGKTTLLKTIGVNIVLANSGTVVCAEQMSLSTFRPVSSIIITDSLKLEQSYLLTEIKKLKKIVSLCYQKTNKYQIFYIIDNLFKSIHGPEKRKSALKFLKMISASDNYGIITTSDYDLLKSNPEELSLTCYCFNDSIENNKLKFNYKLTKGINTSTNSLKIIEQEGLFKLEES